MMNKLINTYDLAARIAPVTLALSPVIIGILALLHVAEVQGVTFASVVVTLLFLLSVVVREAGKKAEKSGIFKNPQPIADFLKYKGKHASNEDDYPIDQEAKKVAHREIECIINKQEKGGKFKIPKKHSERKEAIYEIAGNCLIDIMRDREKWPIIYDKNVRFAFIRNLYSIKWICIVLNLIVLLITFSYFGNSSYYDYLFSLFNFCGEYSANSNTCNIESHKLFSIASLFIIYMIFTASIIILLFIITKEKVIRSAYEYAKHLMISMLYYDEIMNTPDEKKITLLNPTKEEEKLNDE